MGPKIPRESGERSHELLLGPTKKPAQAGWYCGEVGMGSIGCGSSGEGLFVQINGPDTVPLGVAETPDPPAYYRLENLNECPCSVLTSVCDGKVVGAVGNREMREIVHWLWMSQCEAVPFGK